MSHPGLPGWFPECLYCGAGHLGPIVCLVPHQEDTHLPMILDRHGLDERLLEEDGHWFKMCQLCDMTVSADPVAIGSFALCVVCWNSFLRQGLVPPTDGPEIRRVGEQGLGVLRAWP